MATREPKFLILVDLFVGEKRGAPQYTEFAASADTLEEARRVAASHMRGVWRDGERKGRSDFGHLPQHSQVQVRSLSSSGGQHTFAKVDHFVKGQHLWHALRFDGEDLR